MGTEASKFSFRRRTIDGNDPNFHIRKQKLPGPGHYGVNHGLGINKIGKYYLSNMKNSQASVFSPSKRFRESSSTLTTKPGPGTYEPTDIRENSEKVRTMLLSHFRTNMPSRMVQPYFTQAGERPGTTDRSNMNTSRIGETPGPGTYILPSDFGHLDYGCDIKRERRRG